jgi:hypothetical protein
MDPVVYISASDRRQITLGHTGSGCIFCEEKHRYDDDHQKGKSRDGKQRLVAFVDGVNLD